MPRIKTRDYHISWLRQRELGHRRPLGDGDRFSKEIYSSIMPCTCWDHSEHLRNALHGGVFNLEFSPDGSLLVAACEKKSILMFDPLCRKLVHAVDNAHRDCVNCVRFLDSRVFATCSDDSTVALWDSRNLKTQIRTLHGHSNWVKNIEFSSRDSLLVTSGFDGSIYTWDINSYTETGFVYKRVFHTNGLMRTRLNPDASKMILCTSGGYLMIIHDLDLNTLAQDLAGFKPNMYRLMQLSQTTIPLAADFTHLFSKTRQANRVEIVSDFPKGDDAEVVSSLQIHPQGWCALSRNISNDESSEWTCVHDIQEQDVDIECNPEINADMREELKPDSDSESEPDEAATINGPSVGSVANNAGHRRHYAVPHFLGRSNLSDSRRSDIGIPVDVRRTVDERGRRGFSPASVELHVSSSDVWEALVAIREARVRRERERERERAENSRERNQRPQRNQGTENRLSRTIELLGGEEDIGNEDVAAATAARRRIRTGTVRILVHRNSGNLTDSQRSEAVPSPRILRIHGRSGSEPTGMSTSHSITSRTTTESSSHRNDNSADGNTQIASSSSGVYVIDRSDNQPQTSGTSNTSSSTVSESRSLPRMYRLVNNAVRQDNNSNHNRMIHQNIPRLTHYIKEPNLGKGFIKELCFSADGRLICSPYGVGVRLLSFSPDCAELSLCVPHKPPVPLYEIGTNMCHTDIVVSTKFSPKHYLLVSGCLTGKIVWHQPVV